MGILALPGMAPPAGIPVSLNIPICKRIKTVTVFHEILYINEQAYGMAHQGWSHAMIGGIESLVAR